MAHLAKSLPNHWIRRDNRHDQDNQLICDEALQMTTNSMQIKQF